MFNIIKWEKYKFILFIVKYEFYYRKNLNIFNVVLSEEMFFKDIFYVKVYKCCGVLLIFLKCFF